MSACVCNRACVRESKRRMLVEELLRQSGMCMCVYICVDMCVDICVYHKYISVCMTVRVCVCKCVRVGESVRVRCSLRTRRSSVCVFMCVRRRVSMCVFTCVCVREKESERVRDRCWPRTSLSIRCVSHSRACVRERARGREKQRE